MVTTIPKAAASAKSLQAYSNNSLARKTLLLSRSFNEGSPSGNSLLLKGFGSPGKRLMSLARLAVPQTGAR